MASFAGKSSQQFVDNSDDTVDSLRAEIMEGNQKLSEEEAHVKAQQEMAAHHSLSSFGSGNEPIFIPWDEAFTMIGPDLDIETLRFNEKNTTVTLDQAVRPNSKDGTGKAGVGDDVVSAKATKFITEAASLLPHEIQGKSRSRGSLVPRVVSSLWPSLSHVGQLSHPEHTWPVPFFKPIPTYIILI